MHDGDLVVDGANITAGDEFLEVLGNRGLICAEVLGELYLEQCLTESQKKTLRSLPGSRIGSSIAPPTEASGETPAPAADAVVSAISADSADATPPSSVSCGTTAASPSEPVPSAS